MRIGIDCRLAGLKHAGIGRYTAQLVTNLVGQLDATDQLVLFFHDTAQAQEVLGANTSAGTPTKAPANAPANAPTKAPARATITTVIAPVTHYSIAEQLFMPYYYYAQNLDVLHVPHFNAPVLYHRRLILTIHDLLWHHHRGSAVTTLSPFKYWAKYLFYRLIVSWAVIRAAHIITPTKTVKNTLAQYYPRAKRKTSVTLEGVSLHRKEKDVNNGKKSTSTNKRNPRELLYVGSLYPHKNVDLVLRALVKLPEYTLTIIAARSVFWDATKKRIVELGIDKQVRYRGFVSDQELLAAYKQAAALVQPSLSEGFGLTGVEALSLGTPVLASDIPIFKEVYSDAALFFDPTSESSFAHAVKRLETIDHPTQQKKASAIAKKYDWHTMAAQTLKCYKNT